MPLQDLAVGRVEPPEVAHGVDELGRHGDQCARRAAGPRTRDWFGGSRGPFDHPVQTVHALVGDVERDRWR